MADDPKFANVGLTEVKLDRPWTETDTDELLASKDSTSSSTQSNGLLTSGFALLQPVPKFPVPDDLEWPRQVWFEYISAKDSDNVYLAKRSYQLGVRLARKRAFMANPSPLSPVPTSAEGSHSPDSAASTPANLFSYLKEPIAFWEEPSGFWIIHDDHDRNTLSIEDFWVHSIQGRNREEAGKNSEAVNKDALGKAGSICAMACETLIQVTQIIQSLHQQHTALTVVSPNFFRVRLHLMTSEEYFSLGEVARHQDFSYQIELVNFSTVSLLPNYKNIPTTMDRDNPFSLHKGCATDWIDVNPSMDHILTRRFLKFLSPEMLSISRYLVSTPASDIFAFGAFAYELVVGFPVEQIRAIGLDLLSDIHSHVTREVTPPDIVPPQLSTMIMTCVENDTDDRYYSPKTLLYDLTKFKTICQRQGDSSRFVVGEANRISRFRISEDLVDREAELEALDKTLLTVNGSGDQGLLMSICVWGVSGSGKSKLTQRWVEDKDFKKTVMLGWAKLDQHIKKPLSGFTQLFESLLDRVFSDPKEVHRSRMWRKKILNALGHRTRLFLSLISAEWRDFLLLSDPDVTPPSSNEINWGTYMSGFEIWSKRLLQVFASRERPLVLVLDDIQWLAPEELSLWQTLLRQDMNRLENVLVISLYRTQSQDEPPPSSLNLPASISIPIKLLKEKGVEKFLAKSFAWDTTEGKPPSSHLEFLIAFLFSQTQGNPFYLRSLIEALVRNEVLSFHFNLYRWRIDLRQLQKHSSLSVDDFVERTQESLSRDVQEVIQTLSCLRSRACRMEHLAALMNKPLKEIEILLHGASTIGVVVVIGRTAKFSHDRQQHVAYRSIPQDQRASIHFKIANYLLSSDLAEDFLYDVVDNFLFARKLDHYIPNEDELVNLACQAAHRANRSASSQISSAYLQAADSIAHFSEPEAWLRIRKTCFLYAQTYAECCAIMSSSDAVDTLVKFLKFCTTIPEELEICTSIVRLYIVTGDHAAAVNRTLDAIARADLSSSASPEVQPKLPVTVGDFDAILKSARDSTGSDLSLRDETIVALCRLTVYVGPTLYVTCEDHGRSVFELMVTIGMSSRAVSAAPDLFANLFTALPISAPLSISLDTQKLYVDCAKQLSMLKERSRVECNFLLNVDAQRLVHDPLSLVTFDASFEASRSVDFSIMGYSMAQEFATRLLSGASLDFFFRKLMYYYTNIHLAPPHARTSVDMIVQALENLSSSEGSFQELSKLNGKFVNHVADYKAVESFPLYQLGWVSVELHLALFFGRPYEELKCIIKKGPQNNIDFSSMVQKQEWLFMSSLVIALYGSDKEQRAADKSMDYMCRFSNSIDYSLRRDIVKTLRLTRSQDNWSSALRSIEAVIDKCDELGRPMLSGLVNFYTARWLHKMNCIRPMLGYAHSSRQAYSQAKALALSRLVTSEFAVSFAPFNEDINAIQVPSDLVASRMVRPPSTFPDLAPLLSTLDSSVEHRLGEENGSEIYSEQFSPSEIENLTFVRSSLVLAREKEPDAIVVKLLRILLQFVRADYGALALVDGTSSNLHLRAAGGYKNLSVYDIPLSSVETLAPASTLLSVFRTRKGVSSLTPSDKSTMNDSFFSRNPPRSILAVPLENQRQVIGVVLLSSKNYSIPASQMPKQMELVSSLATFAAISIESSLSNRSLEAMVATRTYELSEAMSSKQQFISNCSHELRTPLFAILGLVGVLQDSSDLSPTQMEHLETIRKSGDDLQTVIGNVLDLSKIQSQSLVPEKIPYDLRSTVELAIQSVALSIQNKNIEVAIATDCTDDPPSMLGDPYRIRQILLNFLSNAAKFTEKGSISVRWKTKRIDSDDKACYVEIHVDDTGFGIPAHRMDRLFQAFSQVDESITRSHGGSGLGLVISRTLARLLGGDAWAESTIGHGTTFSFSFLSELETSSNEHQVSKYSTLNSFSACLIYDGGPITRRLLEQNLYAFGAKQVVVHSTLGEAKSLSLVNTRFSFIFVEPRYLDKEKLQALANSQPNAKIVLLTRISDLARVTSSLKTPYSFILSCPIRIDSLYDILNKPDEKQPHPIQTPKKIDGSDKQLAKDNPLKILLVDDNKVNTVVGRKILERFGYTDVDVAYDGDQAVNRAESNRYDLILMDLSMPICDGHAATQRIFSSPLTGQPKVIALTANTDSDTRARCVAEGFYSYLSKPLNIAGLRDVLQKIKKQ